MADEDLVEAMRTVIPATVSMEEVRSWAERGERAAIYSKFCDEGGVNQENMELYLQGKRMLGEIPARRDRGVVDSVLSESERIERKRAKSISELEGKGAKPLGRLSGYYALKSDEGIKIYEIGPDGNYSLRRTIS